MAKMRALQKKRVKNFINIFITKRLFTEESGKNKKKVKKIQKIKT